VIRPVVTRYGFGLRRELRASDCNPTINKDAANRFMVPP
jgi:hypothetical protein